MNGNSSVSVLGSYCGKSSENASHRDDRRTWLLTTTNVDQLAGNRKC